MKRLTGLLLLVALLAALTGCGGTSGEPQPPTIRYGQDVSEMGMIISDPRFAAAIIPERGDAILFDDIGELCKYVQTHPSLLARARFVHEFAGAGWLRAERAWYVRSAEFRSPMGWGVAAFGEEAAARQAQRERGGDVLTWDALARQDWSHPPAPSG